MELISVLIRQIFIEQLTTLSKGLGQVFLRKEEGDARSYNDLVLILERLRRNRR